MFLSLGFPYCFFRQNTCFFLVCLSSDQNGTHRTDPYFAAGRNTAWGTGLDVRSGNNTHNPTSLFFYWELTFLLSIDEGMRTSDHIFSSPAEIVDKRATWSERGTQLCQTGIIQIGRTQVSEVELGKISHTKVLYSKRARFGNTSMF